MKRKNNISVQSRGVSVSTAQRKFTLEVLSKLVEIEKAVFSGLNIMFCADKEMRYLNATYRKKNKPTDILTFCYEAGKQNNMYGDVAISVQTAKRQAKQFKHTFKEELAVLLTHGIYHLMGYDHIKNNDYLRMKKKEEEALKQLKQELFSRIRHKNTSEGA